MSSGKVSNADAHDHVGGDGAQVDHVNLANIGTKTHAQIDSAIGFTPMSTVISRTTVAGESIAAGNVVGQFRTGIRKGYGLKTGSAELDLIAANLSVIAITWLTSTLFVLAYRKAADGKVYASAFTMAADWSISVTGAEATIANYATVGLKIRRGNDTTCIISWCDNAGVRTGRLFASANSVGALNAITVGAEAEINPTSSVYTLAEYSWDFKLLTTSTLLFAYRDAGNSNYLRACVVTWNTGTLALTVNADVQMNSAAVDDVSMAVWSTTRARVYYESSGVYCITIKVAGTVPSALTAYGAALTGSIGSGSDADNINSELDIISLNLYTNPSPYWGVGCYGYNYSVGAAGELNAMAYNALYCISTSGKNRMRQALPGSYCVHNNNTSGWIEWSINRLQWRPQNWQTGNLIHITGNDFDMDIDSTKTALAVAFTDTVDTHHGHLLIYDVGYPIGIAAEANNGGEALNIIVAGYSSVQSGLVLNQRQYALMTGLFTTAANGWPIMDPLSATEAIVNLNLTDM